MSSILLNVTRRTTHTIISHGRPFRRRSRSIVERRADGCYYLCRHQQYRRRGTRWSSSNSSTTTTKTSKPQEDQKLEFSIGQVFLQWSVGLIVSTPIIAILQGTSLLYDYRTRFSDAPRPKMPARGVAIAVDDDYDDGRQWWWKASSFGFHQRHQDQLRILIVGDSLAAGVGMSKSGVPILPESIARALSRALDGRPVYWTCVGTPGVSASQIVQDIYSMDDDVGDDDQKVGDNQDSNDATAAASTKTRDNDSVRRLERLVKEFQTRRRRWQDRRRVLDVLNEKDERIVDKPPLGEDNTIQADKTTLKTESKKNKDTTSRTDNMFLNWWKEIRRKEKLQPSEVRDTTRKAVVEWWSNIRERFKKRREQVQEDINVIKEIVKLEPMVDEYDDDEYYYDFFRENQFDEDEINRIDKERFPLGRKGSVFRRASISPQAAAKYDIAIVLTGLNDVKDAFMPHMTGGVRIVGGLKNQLFNVLVALRSKMDKMDLEIETNSDEVNCTETENSTQQPKGTRADLRRPMVVVPELPVAPLQIFRLVPLKWFLVPIFRGMENNKKFIAKMFPEYVIFVPQPDLEWWTDDEVGIGPIRANIEKEQLLFRVTDIAHTAQDRIQGLMKKYYDAKHEENASSTGDHSSNYKDNPYGPTSEIAEMENERLIQIIDDDHRSMDKSKTSHDKVPASYVSVDKMHPNDEGYEIWGRHIAAAILERWDRD